MVMYLADLAPSFDALEAMDPAFVEMREQYGLNDLDTGISTAKLDTSASLTVPNGSQDNGIDDRSVERMSFHFRLLVALRA